MDVYSEAFIGYHICQNEDYEAQYNAYRMALQTSGCKPYEIRFDNQGGHKKLMSSALFANLARLAIATKPHNGKSKTIENAFGRYQMQYLKKDWFFTGQNIQAKRLESKANMEFILANKANLKTLDEIKRIYAERREEWNNAPHHETGIPRIEMYRTSRNPKRAKNLLVADRESLPQLIARLKRPKSPNVVFIDSLQYFDISYSEYKALKVQFPKKLFVFISHADGKEPAGAVAKKVRYDADLKVWVEGYKAFVHSRNGGGEPYVIWQDGADKYWVGNAE